MDRMYRIYRMDRIYRVRQDGQDLRDLQNRAGVGLWEPVICRIVGIGASRLLRI